MPSADAPAHELLVVDTSTPEFREQCMKIRFAVFVDEQHFPSDVEIDKYDEPGASFHLLLRLVPSQEPIGTVRLIDLSPTNKKLGRLCVLKEYRSFKFGKDLVLASHRAILQRAQVEGIIEELEVSLHSQVYVKGFYNKCGYVEVGGEFDEDGAPHQKMVCQLSVPQSTLRNTTLEIKMNSDSRL